MYPFSTYICSGHLSIHYVFSGQAICQLWGYSREQSNTKLLPSFSWHPSRKNRINKISKKNVQRALDRGAWHAAVHGVTKSDTTEQFNINNGVFSCKEYNQSEFRIDYLVMSMCRVFSCVAGRGCLL